MVRTFQDLIVWQKAHKLVLDIYRITRCFPDEEKYGVVSQIRRSAISVPANIVEGFKRKGKKEFCHYLTIADSSLEETKYHLLLCHDLAYIKNDNYVLLHEQCSEIGRMLTGSMRTLNK
jgi:four helix bundle protein